MIKYDRNKKKLIVPSGLGPSSSSYEDGFAAGEASQKAKLESKDITANGTYTREDGWNEVTVEVPTPTFTTQEKSVEITENGTVDVTKDEGYDGMTAVHVTTNIPIEPEKTIDLDTDITEVEPEEGYAGMSKVTVDARGLMNAMYEDGMAEQKGKLTTLVVTSNGQYAREDGYNEVNVIIPIPRPKEIETEKNYEVVSNTGSVTPSEGYDGIARVNVDATSFGTSRYSEGVADGKQQQEAIDEERLTDSLSITENGTYEADYGYKEVVVDIPSVPTKVNVKDAGIRFGNSGWSTVRDDLFDFSTVTNWNSMFTSNTLLATFPDIINFNTATNLYYAIQNCKSLRVINGVLDFTIYGSGQYTGTISTNVTGFLASIGTQMNPKSSSARFANIGFGQTSTNGTYNPFYSDFIRYLDADSRQSFIDALVDYSGGTAHSMKVHSGLLSNLTSDQIAQATAKNWTLS